MRRTLGLQQTWQSSTKLCLRPADSSTEVEFHSPQAAHWKPESKVEKAYRNECNDFITMSAPTPE
jgi:hypothetical protein